MSQTGLLKKSMVWGQGMVGKGFCMCVCDLEGSDFETLNGDLAKGGWLGSILLGAIGKVREIPISGPHLFFESQKLFGSSEFYKKILKCVLLILCG